ncbi:hypothetical protein [Geodermatophilus sp. URMC 62]|uniref:hypothetical protein n=1 Tax=Geodermatophilus sp. URMC 62 TaxID=3423414 RepID=UPI00406C50B3
MHDVIVDEGGLAIDATSRFAALRDAPDLVVGPLAEGEYYEARYFIHYRLRNGKVARIEAARTAPMTGPHQLSDEERAALAR